MTPEKDFIGALEDYLDDYEGDTPLPESVRDAIRAELPTTKQIGAFPGPMRHLRMSPSLPAPARYGLAAAAVLAAALVGAAYFGRGDNVGLGPTAPPTPEPRLLTPSGGALDPGTYVTGDPFSLRVTFTVPAGWEGWVAGPYRVDLEWADKPGGIFFYKFESVFADPCHADEGFVDPPPGPTANDLVTALAGMPGIDVTDVSDVSVDGYSGQQLTMSAPAGIDGCAPPGGAYMIWELPLGTRYTMVPGERDRLWILDVDGERLVIDIPEAPGYTNEQRAEVQRIFESIRIEPAD